MAAQIAPSEPGPSRSIRRAVNSSVTLTDGLEARNVIALSALPFPAGRLRLPDPQVRFCSEMNFADDEVDADASPDSCASAAFINRRYLSRLEALACLGASALGTWMLFQGSACTVALSVLSLFVIDLIAHVAPREGVRAAGQVPRAEYTAPTRHVVLAAVGVAVSAALAWGPLSGIVGVSYVAFAMALFAVDRLNSAMQLRLRDPAMYQPKLRQHFAELPGRIVPPLPFFARRTCAP